MKCQLTCHFNAEENSTDRSSEVTSHAHSTGRGEQFVREDLVRVYGPETRQEVAQPVSDYAGEMHEGTLLPDRKPRPRCGKETADLSDECWEGEIVD